MPAPRTYDWAVLADGDLHAVDFEPVAPELVDAQVRRLRKAASVHAHRHQLEVRTTVVPVAVPGRGYGKRVAIQFRPRSEDGSGFSPALADAGRTRTGKFAGRVAPDAVCGRCLGNHPEAACPRGLQAAAPQFDPAAERGGLAWPEDVCAMFARSDLHGLQGTLDDCFDYVAVEERPHLARATLVPRILGRPDSYDRDTYDPEAMLAHLAALPPAQAEA